MNIKSLLKQAVAKRAAEKFSEISKSIPMASSLSPKAPPLPKAKSSKSLSAPAETKMEATYAAPSLGPGDMASPVVVNGQMMGAGKAVPQFQGGAGANTAVAYP